MQSDIHFSVKSLIIPLGALQKVISPVRRGGFLAGGRKFAVKAENSG